jgi:hypothetical protein
MSNDKTKSFVLNLADWDLTASLKPPAFRIHHIKKGHGMPF